jgi:hypothetical protein
MVVGGSIGRSLLELPLGASRAGWLAKERVGVAAGDAAGGQMGMGVAMDQGLDMVNYVCLERLGAATSLTNAFLLLHLAGHNTLA